MQTREIGLGDQAFYEQTVDDKTSKSKSQILIKKKFMTLVVLQRERCKMRTFILLLRFQ